MNLQKVFCKANRYNPGAASHTTEIETTDVASQLVSVNDHGGEGRRGIEEAAVDDEDADVFRFDPGGGEEVIKGPEHDLLGLLPGRLHRWPGRNRVHSLGNDGLLSESRSLQDLALELEGGAVEVAGEAGVFHEAMERGLEVGGGTVAGVVQEIDGSGSGHEVEGEGEDEEDGEGEDGVEVVVVEVGQEGEEVEVDEEEGEEREEEEGYEVGDEVVVSQLHVLEVHVEKEVGEAVVVVVVLLLRGGGGIG
ncbi:hypothetical protein Drorol1_Dr00005630 [Drosera rotundifolia]